MGLRKIALSGMRYQVYLKIASVAFYQVGTIILAILLSPADFSTLGLAMIFIGFAANLSDFGIGSALIQRPSLPTEDLATGGSLRILTSSVLTLALFISAPRIASSYRVPALQAAIWVLSLILVANSLGFSSRILLTRNLQFRRLFVPEVAGNIAATLSMVLLALAGWSFWSLLLGAVLGSFVTAIGFYFARPWRFALRIDKKIAAKLLSFGAPLLLGNLLAFASEAIGVGILGFFAFQDVGFFLFATTWTISIFVGLHASLDNVLFPVYSAMNADVKRVRGAYLRLLKYLSWAIFPLGALVVTEAPVFVLGIVGSKWSPSIPLMQILGIAAVPLVLSLSYHSAVVAVGKPRELLLYQTVAVSVSVPLSFLLIQLNGAIGLAYAILITGVVLFFYSVTRTRRLLHVAGRELFRNLWPQALASVLVAVPVAAVRPWFSSTPLFLGASTIGAIAAYFGLMTLFTRRGFFPEVIGIVRDFVR